MNKKTKTMLVVSSVILVIIIIAIIIMRKQKSKAKLIEPKELEASDYVGDLNEFGSPVADATNFF